MFLAGEEMYLFCR